jgi:hypothetical protein
MSTRKAYSYNLIPWEKMTIVSISIGVGRLKRDGPIIALTKT